MLKILIKKCRKYKKIKITKNNKKRKVWVIQQELVQRGMYKNILKQKSKKINKYQQL